MNDTATSTTPAAPTHGRLLLRTVRTHIRHKITLAVILAITVAMGINETLHSWLQEASATRRRRRAGSSS